MEKYQSTPEPLDEYLCPLEGRAAHYEDMIALTIESAEELLEDIIKFKLKA